MGEVLLTVGRIGISNRVDRLCLFYAAALSEIVDDYVEFFPVFGIVILISVFLCYADGGFALNISRVNVRLSLHN